MGIVTEAPETTHNTSMYGMLDVDVAMMLYVLLVMLIIDGHVEVL